MYGNDYHAQRDSRPGGEYRIWFMSEKGVGWFDAHASTQDALALGLRTLEEDASYVVLNVEEVVPL